MSYLISISIGPVQDFIASARRSRDLWFGSWLLSELSKTVAKKIGKDNLIFPAISYDGQLEENSRFNVVNKIVAIVPNIEAGFDESLKVAIEERLEKIYKPIFNKIDTKIENEFPRNGKIFYRAEAEAQIKDMTELYWAAIPFDEDDKTIDKNGKSVYEKTRERVEILLNARKSTRNFAASTTWADNVPKSSLDGQRESVIEDKKIDDVKIQKIFGLRKKERLCGVGVLKRLAEKGTDDRFFSTSHIGSLPLLSTLKNDENTENAVNEYIGKIADLLFEYNKKELYKYIGRVPENLKHEVFQEYDGHLLFENRLIDLPFESQAQLDQAKQALNEFKTVAFGKETAKPLPYYALLLADGDRMGTVIDNQKDKDAHKNLSKVLSEFAASCKSIVEKHSGSLIYSGGDDVLAFLPLHTVLDCAKKLSDDFAEKLGGFKDADDKTPTLSVGVAIYHHTEPLQDALTTMRQAEEEAKSVTGKNALAIILSKRSGADTTIKDSWANDRNTGKSFDERLKWFVQLHLDDALPDGVAYELRDLWLRFQDLRSGTVLPSYEKLLKAETIRILNRKKSDDGKKDVDKKVLKDLKDLVEKISLIDKGEEKVKWTLLDLANEIIVARDFAKAYKQANIKEIL